VLVDDAIIGIEKCLAGLARMPSWPKPRSSVSTSSGRDVEVRGPWIYSTLVVIIVFPARAVLPQCAGKIRRTAGARLPLAVLASLLVALTAAPRPPPPVGIDAQGSRSTMRLRLDSRMKAWHQRGVVSSNENFRIVSRRWRC